MHIETGKTYSSGSELHQREVIAVTGGEVTYRVVSSHAAITIGRVHQMDERQFSRWAFREIGKI